MRKGRHKLLGLAALASLMLIGGTWAVWTQEIQTGNEFMPGIYDTTLDEKFDSPDDWQPGKEQEKKVWVTNKGTVPVMAKAVITQSWIRREDVYATQVDAEGNVVEEKVRPYKGEAFPLTFNTDSGVVEYAAIPNFNKENVVLWSEGNTAVAADESLSLGLKVVDKIEDARGKWILMNDVPDENGQYLLYYIGVIESGQESPVFLDSVTLNDELARTITGKETYYAKLSDGSTKKVTIDRVNPAYGYDSAKYTMDIKATTVQATKAAVEEVFGKDGETLTYLAEKIAESGVFESGTTKTLKFEEADGKMVYTPYRNGAGKEEGNWFMSFTNMIPGGTYVDSLEIENASSKKYDLYMQVVPRVQDDALKDELLELIRMDVYYDGTLLYSGKATGAALKTEEGLQRVVPLGQYAGGTKGKIEVKLQLDPALSTNDELSHKYAGVLTKIDWKFMVTEVKESGKPGGTTGGGGKKIPDNKVPLSDTTVIEDIEPPLAVLPKTGDEAPIIPLLVTLLGSGIILLYLFTKLRREEKEGCQ